MRGKSLIRQWNLIKILQSRRFGISSDELAKRLKCSKRQILRDIHVLQEVGFPIDYEVRDYGKRFWKLPSKFLEQEGLTLSMTEMLSLYIGHQLLKPLLGTHFEGSFSDTLDKIKTILPVQALHYFENLNDVLFVKQTAWHDYAERKEQIEMLQQAIINEQIVHLKYRSVNSKQIKSFTFHPYEMVFFGAGLYCIGFVEEYHEIRILKLTRILAMELSEKEFIKPMNFSAKDWLSGSFGVIITGKPTLIKAKFSDWAAINLKEYQWHESQKIIEETDEYIIVTFRLTSTTEFKRWILGFGKHAIILSPPELRKEIKNELTTTLRLYG